ncbi:hypothetical protein [Symbiopectobacterium sp. RP]|uniref:hypothetical protein n=1 Tax=Symbiopectobacterium sp. RP TaxID=3248553 RepID=UPI003D29BCE3
MITISCIFLPHIRALAVIIFKSVDYIARVESLDTGKKLVHLIDREGDSSGICAH